MLNLHAILFGRRTAFFADRPMKEHSVLRFFRALLKPFKLINYKLSHSISKKLEDAVASWISFIAASFVIIRCYPYKGLFDFLFTLFGAFILAIACALAVAFLFPKILKILSGLFWIPAIFYDICDDKINNVSRKKEKNIKKGPRAEVGIKYFIEREKRIHINHAKYLG